MNPRGLIIAATALLLLSSLASAAEMPAAFQGQWVQHDPTNFETTWGVHIGPHNYFMPGMDCTLDKVSNKPDSQNSNARVFILDMTCRDEGYHAPPPTKVRETWAMRDGILVTATPSSISVMHRGELK